MIIGLGFLGINLVWIIFNSFVLLFLQAENPEFEQSAAVAGSVLSGVIVDMFGNNYRMLWAVGAVYVLLAYLFILCVQPKGKEIAAK